MLVKSSTLALLLAAGSVSARFVPTSSTEKIVKQDADFGLCVPTLKYEGGLGGRPAAEFSFEPIDPLCADGQPEALNPNIITNRICDQLSSVCGANDAAKSLCREAQTKIRALGTRNKSTADTWNTLLGFAGALTNPDGGLDEPTGEVRDLKKRDSEANSKRAVPFIACSATEWIDSCTGWSASDGVVKREALPAPVVNAPVAEFRKITPKSAPEKRDVMVKRQIPFIPCSTTEWLDDCTGWP